MRQESIVAHGPVTQLDSEVIQNQADEKFKRNSIDGLTDFCICW